MRLIIRSVALFCLAASPFAVVAGSSAPSISRTSTSTAQAVGEIPAGGTFLLIGTGLIGFAALSNRRLKNRSI